MGEKEVGGNETSRVSSFGRWLLLAVLVAVFSGLVLIIWSKGRPDEGRGGEFAYGFSGEVHRFGDPAHEIVYGEGVEQNTLESLGDYLERVGYFSPNFGGVIQIRSRDGGYDVYLTYSKSYWDLPEFIDEVSSIREDLETNVLKKSTRIILVDEDESGVYTRALD